MTTAHSYSNPEGRKIFRLRDFANRPNHGFDLERPTPDGYVELSEADKISVAEFVNFIFNQREEDGPIHDGHFYLRDHENRPLTTELATPAEAPARYLELSEEERFHVHEFLGFLRGSRTAEGDED
jgi:hypothetical protein